MTQHRILGLLAGKGDLPSLIAAGARAQGHTVVTAALAGETAPDLKGLSHHFDEVAMGAIGAVREVFEKGHVQDIVMAGSFPKHRLFSRMRPDLDGIKLLARLGGQMQDDVLLRAIAAYFESHGMHVVAVPPFIPDHMAPGGVLTSRKPTPDEEKDIAYGMEVARTTGRLDIGQTVVVRRGTVLAVEAVEGTDEAIKRGAALGRQGTASGKGGVVVCKVVKPSQDLRLDLPAVGPKTVDVCAENEVRVLAVQSLQTILVDRPKTIAHANDRKLVVVGVPAPQ